MKSHRHKKIAKVSHRKVESFSSSDFLHHPKNHFWYLGISLLLLGFLLLTLQAGDYLLSTVVVVAAIAIFRLSNLHPETKKVEINHRGVTWGKRFLGFHQLKSFWVDQAGGQVRVYLDQINFRPTLSFELPHSNMEKTLEALSEHLPYHPHKSEPLSERFSRFLRL